MLYDCEHSGMHLMGLKPNPLEDPIFLQCFDTVGWVIRPVKSHPRIHMAYVFGGTLNLTQLQLLGTSKQNILPSLSVSVASCVINLWAFCHTPRICNLMNLLISWVHSFTESCLSDTDDIAVFEKTTPIDLIKLL